MDEFPGRLHAPPGIRSAVPEIRETSAEVRDAIERLDRDHARESAVRELQHLLTAWELLGDTDAVRSRGL